MAKKVQLWSFVFLAKKVNPSVNVLTDSFDESDIEFTIPCFDGFSYFTVNGKYYVMSYPKLKNLTAYQREIVEMYCGYEPTAGEYGVIAGALGECVECDENMFEHYLSEYPLSKKNIKRLGWYV